MDFAKAEFLKGLPTFRVDSFDVDRKSGELLTPTADVACLLYRVTYNTGTGPMKAALRMSREVSSWSGR